MSDLFHLAISLPRPDSHLRNLNFFHIVIAHTGNEGGELWGEQRVLAGWGNGGWGG